MITVDRESLNLHTRYCDYSFHYRISANCPSPTITNSDFATDRGETDHGDYIIVTCDDGFTSGTGDNVSEPVTCGEGSWDVDVYCYGEYDRVVWVQYFPCLLAWFQTYLILSAMGPTGYCSYICIHIQLALRKPLGLCFPSVLCANCCMSQWLYVKPVVYLVGRMCQRSDVQFVLHQFGGLTFILALTLSLPEV